jgi:hypothetical protein
LAYIQACEAVAVVAFVLVEETQVAGEKSGTIQFVQQWNDMFFVLHSLPPRILANLTETESPFAQQLALILGNILIKENHTGVGADSGNWSRKALLANRTASAMAAWLTAPRHCLSMAFHAMPWATCSSTSLTSTRVPRKVGCP